MVGKTKSRAEWKCELWTYCHGTAALSHRFSGLGLGPWSPRRLLGHQGREQRRAGWQASRQTQDRRCMGHAALGRGSRLGLSVGPLSKGRAHF